MATPSVRGKARMTGLEPATSGVTGRCSNQLSYIPNGLVGTAIEDEPPDLGNSRSRGLLGRNTAAVG